MIRRGADVQEPQSDTFNTPLHEAVKQYKQKKNKVFITIIELLISNGADVEAKNKQGKTALDSAEKSKA